MYFKEYYVNSYSKILPTKSLSGRCNLLILFGILLIFFYFPFRPPVLCFTIYFNHILVCYSFKLYLSKDWNLHLDGWFWSNSWRHFLPFPNMLIGFEICWRIFIRSIPYLKTTKAFFLILAPLANTHNNLWKIILSFRWQLMQHVIWGQYISAFCWFKMAVPLSKCYQHSYQKAFFLRNLELQSAYIT
jgi:hypothetical protein